MHLPLLQHFYPPSHRPISLSDLLEMSSEGSGEATGNSNSRKRSRRESDSQPSKKTKGNTKKSLISGKVKKKTGDDVDDKQEPVSSAAANSHTDEAIGKMDSRLLADFVAQKAQRHNDNLTSVELSDMYLPGKLILETDAGRFSKPGRQAPFVSSARAYIIRSLFR